MKRPKAVLLSSVLVLAQSFLPLGALSQTVPNNLDLSSTAATETARHAATINVNGNSVSVAVNDQLTPAERVAVSQVHYTGTQSIVLGADGSAVGGTFNLSAAAKNGVSNLVIPQNVTAVQDVARLANVNIVSDLVNSGTIQVLSQSASALAGSIAAQNILNHQGASITSVLPSGGIAGYLPAVNNVNMTLNAVQNLTNRGSIISSADLTAIAGGTLTNSLQGATGALPVMQAVNNLNIFTGGGTTTTFTDYGTFVNANVLNSGLISALNGNVSIATLAPNDLTITNTNGLIEALSGQVNIRDSGYTATSNLIMHRGAISANEVNFYNGSGTTRVNMDEIVGITNAYGGGSGSVGVSKGDLVVGEIQLGSSTVIGNYSGNIRLTKDLSYGGRDIVIGAGGDISTSVSGISIDSSSQTGNAGNITVAAGHPVFASSLGPFPLDNPVQINDGVSKIFITVGNGGYGSATGGNIDFSTNPISKISAVGSAKGGIVTLSATSDAAGVHGSNFGDIKLPTLAPIDTSGTSVDGKVIIFAQNYFGAAPINSASSSGGTVRAIVYDNASFGSITASQWIELNSFWGTLSLTDNSTLRSGAVGLDARTVILGSDTKLIADVPLGYKNNDLLGLAGIRAGTIVLPSGSKTTIVINDGFAGIGPAIGSQSLRDLNIVTSGAAPSELLVSPTGTTKAWTQFGRPLNYGATLVLYATENLTIGENVTLTSPDRTTAIFDVYQNAMSFDNQGTIKVGGANFAGAFLIAVPLLFSAPQNMVIKSLGNLSFRGGASTGAGGTLEVFAPQFPVIFNGGSVSADASGGDYNGGQIFVTAKDFANSGSTPLNFSANGAGNGSGGQIEIASKGVVPNVGPGAGEMILSASGGSFNSSSGNGGKIVIDSGNSLSIDTSSLTTNPLGINGNGGSVALTTSGALQLKGALDLHGKGTGNGGSIALEINNDLPFILDSNTKLLANGGDFGTKGGSISVKNGLSGGIVLMDDALLSVSAGTNSDGGSIELSAKTGAVTLHQGLSVDAGTSGGNGGTLTIEGEPIVVQNTGSSIILSAKGSGTGDGGAIAVLSRGDEADLTVGDEAGQLKLEASSGANGGNGGSIKVQSGRDLSVNASGISAGPNGPEGRGATVSLESGTDVLGQLKVNGSLSVDSKGDEDAGQISLTYNDDESLFALGSTVLASGVSGDLTAKAAGLGSGGSILITNNSPDAGITTSVLGKLDTSSAQGKLGEVKFDSAYGPVSIDVIGDLNGQLSAHGLGVDVTLHGDERVLNIGFVDSGAGASLSVKSGSSRISLPNPDSMISALDSVNLSSPQLTNNGTILSWYGNINIQNTAGSSSLIVDGSGGLFNLYGYSSETPTISLTTVNDAPIYLNGSLTYNPSYVGFVDVKASHINIGDGAVQKLENPFGGGDSIFRFTTGRLEFGKDASIANTTTEYGPGLLVENGAYGNSLKVVVQANVYFTPKRPVISLHGGHRFTENGHPFTRGSQRQHCA